MSDNESKTPLSTPVATATATTPLTTPPVVQEGGPLAAYQELDANQQQAVDQLIAEIDLTDTNSVIYFGSKAQQQLTSVSDSMLEDVQNKDVGRAGEALNEVVTTIRGFDLDTLDPNQKHGWFDRLLGRAKPLAKFVQRYEDVRNQIERISDQLERHKTQLLTDIASLDRLYDANLDYFHALERYIIAGEQKLAELDQTAIPTLAKEAEASSDVLKSQQLRDLRAGRDDLERRVHDLKLTRQVTMQGLPSIRLVQENDKALVNKINSTLVNTIPLWRQQLAQTVTIFRSGQAADQLKSATDLTNELLAANAENLQQANRKVREQLERGVFDIEVIKAANEKLIATIEESLEIADQGKAQRAAAAIELKEAESQLRASLAAASARAAGAEKPATTPPTSS